MRIFAVVIAAFLPFVAAAASPPPPPPPNLPSGPCDPEQNNHTNPPIVGIKGSSVAWFQCNRASQTWVPLVGSYNVFDDGECVDARLDDDWFGKATEGGEASLEKNNCAANCKVKSSKVKFKNGGYTLEVKLRKPKAGKDRPNTIELCVKGGACCMLQPAADQSLQGKIPYEFQDFDDMAIRYRWWSADGKTPLQFETCKKPGCVH